MTLASDPLSVSVALCTYNGARFIREQIRSICRQSLPPREIVLSDDASSDGCVEIALRTVDDCNRERPANAVALRVLRNPAALRVTKNFEQAAMACEGDLIAFSDQDDAWRPDRLARMVAEFARRPDLLLLHTDARLVDAEGRPLGHSLFQALEVEPFELEGVHGGQAFDMLLRRNLVAGATAVFRRSLLADAAPFPVEWLHDEWLGIVAAAVGPVDLLEDELIDYRQHASNQVGARRHAFVDKLRKLLASRGDMPVRRVRKAELLLARLLALGAKVPPAAIAGVRSKLEHQRVRAALPARRLARCLPVLQEAMTGRYGSFGYGARDVLRDLLEGV